MTFFKFFPRLSVLLALLLGLLIVPAPSFAATRQDGTVLFDESFTLHAGETLEGDIVALGSVVILEAGSVVTGDVVLTGGSAVLAGEIQGSLTAVGVDIQLSDSLRSRADVSLLRCQVSELKQDAIVTPDSPVQNSIWGRFGAPVQAGINVAMRGLWISLAFAAASALFAAGWQERLTRIAQTIVFNPLESGFTGFLSLLLGLPIGLLGSVLVLTCILAPLPFLFWAALLIFSLAGWSALGQLAGARLFAHQTRLQPTMRTALAVLLLSLFGVCLAALGELYFPFKLTFWMFVSLAGAFGLGGAILSRLGARDYRSISH